MYNLVIDNIGDDDMRKMMTVLILLNLFLLVGCNKRDFIRPLPTLDGSYNLVNFISSNLNNFKDPYDPFTVFNESRLEIEGDVLTTIEVTKGNNREYKSEYVISEFERGYFKVSNSYNYVLQNMYYYDLEKGMIEYVIDVAGETRHYIYSKTEGFTNTKIEGGTYELTYASGVFDNHSISINDWTFFQYKVARDKISIYFQVKGEEKTYGHGSYEYGIVGIKVIYDDFEEYLTYDAYEKTLTYRQRTTVSDAQFYSNVVLVFKMT